MLDSLDFLDIGKQWTPTDKDTKAQLDKVQQCKALYDNDILTAYKDVWDRIKTRIEVDSAMLEQVMISLSPIKRLTQLYMDLVLEVSPKFNTDESAQKKLDELLEETNFIDTILEKSFIDGYLFGDGLIQTCIENNKPSFNVITPDLWFPVRDRLNKEKINAHVIAYTYDVEGGGFLGFNLSKQKELVVYIFEKGRHTYRLYSLDGSGTIQKLIEEKEENYSAIWDDFLIFPFNFGSTSWGVYGDSQVVDVADILQEIIVRISNDARILDSHASPSMSGDSSLLEYMNGGELPYFAKKDFYAVDSEDSKPEYLTWEGNLDHSKQQIALMMDFFYLLTATNPQMFGKDVGGNLSGAALEKVFKASIVKAKRMARNQSKAASKALECALAFFGVKSNVTGSYTVGDMDGLADIIERTAIIYQTGLMSQNKAVKSVQPDLNDEQLTEELELIKKNQALTAATDLNDILNKD